MEGCNGSLKPDVMRAKNTHFDRSCDGTSVGQNGDRKKRTGKKTHRKKTHRKKKRICI